MKCHCGRHIREAGYKTCEKCRARSRAYYYANRDPLSEQTLLRTEGFKVCTWCKKVLARTEFSPAASQCRSCRNSIAKERAIAENAYVEKRFPLTPDERRISLLERRAKAEGWVNDIKSKLDCADCDGEFLPSELDWDHLPGYEKLVEIAVLVYQGRLQAIKNEIMKCEVVCRSCHSKRGWKRGQLKGRPRKPRPDCRGVSFTNAAGGN